MYEEKESMAQSFGSELSLMLHTYCFMTSARLTRLQDHPPTSLLPSLSFSHSPPVPPALAHPSFLFLSSSSLPTLMGSAAWFSALCSLLSRPSKVDSEAPVQE